MKIFIIIFISLFITKGYANNMEISGIDISQFNEGFKPQDSFYDYVNHNWLSETEIPDDQIGWGSYMTCLLYTSPSPRDKRQCRMPSSA